MTNTTKSLQVTDAQSRETEPNQADRELGFLAQAYGRRLSKLREGLAEAASGHGPSYWIEVNGRELTQVECKVELLSILLTHGRAAFCGRVGSLLTGSARTTDAFSRAAIEARAEAARDVLGDVRKFLSVSDLASVL